MSLSAQAISKAWSRLSSAQGPAISASGSLLPNRMPPTATTGLGAGSQQTFMAADHATRPPSGQPNLPFLRLLDCRKAGRLEKHVVDGCDYGPVALAFGAF